MKINSDTLPVFLGSSIILLVFVSVGGMLMSYSSDRAAQEKQELQDSFAAYQKKQEDKFKISAPTLPPAQGTGDATESKAEAGELRIGSYSNPPTNITSFGSSATSSRIERPIGDRLSRSPSSSSFTRTQSNYSTGVRSNGLTNNSSSNTNIGSESLVDSLETDDSLGSIDSRNSSFSGGGDSAVRVDAFEEESQF